MGHSKFKKSQEVRKRYEKLNVGRAAHSLPPPQNKICFFGGMRASRPKIAHHSIILSLYLIIVRHAFLLYNRFHHFGRAMKIKFRHKEQRTLIFMSGFINYYLN